MKGLCDVALRTSYISLCAGVGGLDLGLRLAVPGACCVCYVERELTAAEVLAARIAEGWLDDAPIWSDIRTFDARPWRGLVDAVVGGIPCQPYSQAGKRLGADDPRDLWPDALRIIEDARPRFVFIENVAGSLSGLLPRLADDLEALGFRVAAGLFSAEEVGAPHRRERLFVLADAENANRGRAGGGAAQTERPDSVAVHPQGVGDAEGLGYCGAAAPDVARPRVVHAERALAAFPPGPYDLEAWEEVIQRAPSLEPAVRRVAYGTANRLDRLRQLGNGVVPVQAAVAFTYLAAALEGE